MCKGENRARRSPEEGHDETTRQAVVDLLLVPDQRQILIRVDDARVGNDAAALLPHILQVGHFLLGQRLEQLFLLPKEVGHE